MRNQGSKYRRWAPTCSLALLSVALPGATASVAERAEVYGALPNIDMMVISPDGTKVAYRNTVGDKDAMVVHSLIEKRPVGVLGIPEDIVPSSFRFINPDSVVVVVSSHTRLAGFRGRHDVSSAYVYHIEESEIEKLLAPDDEVYRGQTGLGRITGVSPDGKYVYMPAFFGDARGALRYHNYSVFRVDLETPRYRRLHFHGDHYSTDFLVDEEGEVFVHELLHDRKGLHTIEVRRGDDWEQIYSEETQVPSLGLVGITPDYRSLVVGTFDDDTRRRTYYAMSIETGEITDTLFANADADVENVVTNLNRVVYGARFSGFTPSYEFLDEALTDRMRRIVEGFEGNSVWLKDWTEDWKTFVVYVEGSSFSGQFFAIGEDGQPALLANARQSIDDGEIHPVATYRYEAADGLIIPTLLTIPRQRLESLEKLPAVMMPHGGPAAYDRIGFDWLAQGLADQGYLVIQPQFRGSRGFGLDHYEAGHGEWGGKMQSDLSDGLLALIGRGIVDPARVCIVGASYGGYAALVGGAFTPARYKCVVSINGVSDIEDMIDDASRDARHDNSMIAYFERTIGAGELDDDFLASISPLNFVENFTAPVLLLHGEDDEVVSVRQSKRMHSRLRRAGKEVTFIELDEDSHYLSSNRTRVRAMTEIIGFVNAHLQTSPVVGAPR